MLYTVTFFDTDWFGVFTTIEKAEKTLNVYGYTIERITDYVWKIMELGHLVGTVIATETDVLYFGAGEV